MTPRKLLILLPILFFLETKIQAQETAPTAPPDTIQIVEGKVVGDRAVKKRKTYELNSTKSVLYSIIPGGGQIYNRMYWKLPIIVGAYTACYYAISWNNDNLQDYTMAYRDIKSETPLENTAWQDFIPIGADPNNYVNNASFHDQLKRGRDFYRRYRDMSIIITAAVYILVMVDAYVDAELHKFDITPNLTLACTPTYIPPTVTSPNNYGGYGLHLALTF